MNIERRNKYKKKIEEQPRIQSQFDLEALNILCGYIISENASIRRNNITNLNKLFLKMDFTNIINNQEMVKRVNFIRKGIEARLTHGLTDSNLIYKFICGGIMEIQNEIPYSSIPILDQPSIDWVNNTISETLKYSYISEDVNKVMDVFTKFQASDYKTRGEIVKEVEEVVAGLQNKFRQAKSEDSLNAKFSLLGDVYEDSVRQTHKELLNPSRMLRTGMVGLNELLGGGFESTRFYIFLGNSGVGKSMTLLNLAYQMKLCNRNYKTKDPTKRPAIVYLTMENTVRETIQRLFSVVHGGAMENYDIEDVLNVLKNEGELVLTDDNPIDIIITYKPDNSVDTNYLYELYDDLEDDGVEVICMIQDHIKRIRATNKNSELRLALGNVVNECKNFAIQKDIPFITNSHLNRDGSKVAEESVKSKQVDFTKKLGRANVGESMLIIDNSDWSAIIQKEFDLNNNVYMGFQRLKMRYYGGSTSNRDCIYQPFMENNQARLVMDIDAPVPLFKETLRDLPHGMNLSNNGTENFIANRNTNSTLPNSNIGNELFEMDSDNIFTSTNYDDKKIEVKDEVTVMPSVGIDDNFVVNHSLVNPIVLL